MSELGPKKRKKERQKESQDTYFDQLQDTVNSHILEIG